MARTAVIGAGSWGTALAKLLGDAGHEVALWSHNPVVARQIAEQGENREYLPGAKLPETIWVTTELGAALSDAQFVIAVVPSHAFRTVMERAAPNIPAEALIVTATKGIEMDTLKRPSEIITGLLPNHPPPAMLSGPSFAQETAEGDPTAVVIASRDVDVANQAQELFTTDRFRVYTNDDILGVEIAGALKNVIALAAGIARGLGYRHNSRAALITRGLAEITRLGVAMGARPATFAGLAGLGDLVLTCTADLSRNRQVGVRIGQGDSLDDILSGMKMVAEGIKTTAAAQQLAEQEAVEMPIVEQTHAVLFAGKSPRKATADLMLREPKHEHWGIADAT